MGNCAYQAASIANTAVKRFGRQDKNVTYLASALDSGT
jgi:hypothetical protein